MTREEALKVLDTIPTIGEEVDALEMAIKALEQEPCEDAVSRQSMLDAITEIDDNINMDIYTNEVREIIGALPSVTPTQRWIPVSERLPEKNMACLVSVGKFHITQIAIYSDLMQTIDHKIFYQGDYGHDSFRDITEYVNAWMPLPEPYKAEMESEDGILDKSTQ